MTKLIIFDLDGVLVDAKEIHYESLNLAIGEFAPSKMITREEHLSTYDGLPTKVKLKKLHDEKGLNPSLNDKIWGLKQEKAIEVINNKLVYDHVKCQMLADLKKDGYIIYVASNSIRETLKLMLYKTGMIQYVDYFLSNDDVTHPKPHPEIYMRSMVHAGIKPSETLIVEDSVHGREAAISSGGELYGVNNHHEVTYDSMTRKLDSLNDKMDKKTWDGSNMNILIPMAGAGSRFENAGYSFPKPLIDVNNKPMIQVVLENLNIEANYIFIVQKEHYEKYNLQHLLPLITSKCEIVQVDSLTEGAACTTLIAKDLINSDKPLLIANSDQFVEWDSNDFMYSMVGDNVDGGVLTFKSTHPKWSFAKLGDDGFICEIAEKKPISDIATVGLYYWTKGSDYVKYAEQMIEKDIRINGEFYVAPVYNEAILDNLKFKIHNIEKMWGLGTPEDLNNFLDNYNHGER